MSRLPGVMTRGCVRSVGRHDSVQATSAHYRRRARAGQKSAPQAKARGRGIRRHGAHHAIRSVSGGGSYALACAALLPELVSGAASRFRHH